MTIKARIVLMSHLSDVQAHMTNPDNNHKINFVKWLMMKYPNTDTEIDPDAEYTEFLKR